MIGRMKQFVIVGHVGFFPFYRIMVVNILVSL